MNAHHDHGQEGAGEQKAGNEASFVDDLHCHICYGEGNQPCKGLEEKYGKESGGQVGEQGSQQQVQGTGDDFFQLPFHHGSESRHQEHRYDAAPAGGEGVAVQGYGGQVRMADQRAQDTSQDGSAAEFPGRVEAHEDIDAPESSVAHYGQQLEKIVALQYGIVVAGYVQTAGDEAAGNEGGHQGKEDGAQPQQEFAERTVRSNRKDFLGGLAGGERPAGEVA